MPNVAVSGDLAVGAVSGSSGATINGIAIVLDGDPVESHPPCPLDPIHCNATMGSSKQVTVNGIVVVVNGDLATCRHPISASTSVSID